MSTTSVIERKIQELKNGGADALRTNYTPQDDGDDEFLPVEPITEETVFIPMAPMLGDYLFVPKQDISVQELASLIASMQTSIDQKVYDSFAPNVQRHFIKIQKE